MRKYYLKKISILLVITIGVTLLPSINNKASAEETENKIIYGKSNEEEASIVKEIEELREEYSKQYLKSDGTYEAVVYNKPIHYKDGDRWLEIDNSLKEDVDEELKELDEKELELNTNNEIESIKNEEKLNEESVIDNKEQVNSIEEKQETINNNDNKLEKNSEEDKNLKSNDDNNKTKEVEKSKSEEKSEKVNKEKLKNKIDDSKKIRQNEENNILINESNNFSISVSKYSDSKKLIKVNKDDYELSWGIEDVNPVKYENMIKDDNSIKKEIEEIANKKIDKKIVIKVRRN